MAIVIQVLGIVFGFSFLVFIHELGHFLVAKMYKVRVEIFSLGFGPDLIKYVFKGTKYCIKAIPFGGFVKMAGENIEEATGVDGEYTSLKWYKKICILLAGPFLNCIFSIFVFAFIFNFWGISIMSTDSSVGSVLENYPAAVANIIPGDKIKSIDGVNVNTWSDLAYNLIGKVNKQTTFAIERGTSSFNLNMIIKKNPMTGLGAIGISPVIINTEVGFFKSIYFGAKTSIIQMITTVRYFANKLILLESPGITGPVGIMHSFAGAIKSGMHDYLELIAFMSLALGLFNLFPIPSFDGGMIVLFLVEGILGKKISTKVVWWYSIFGLVFIICILFFATYNDLLQLGIINWLLSNV
jgi:regulator of sigma E protease